MKLITKLSLIMSIIGSMFLININVSFAQNQTACSDRTQIVKKLNDKYNEGQAAIGLVKDGRMMEIFASRDGTWTILLTTPDKNSCLVMAGDAFSIIKDIKDLEGIPN